MAFHPGAVVWLTRAAPEYSGTNPTMKSSALLKNRFTFICARASGIYQIVELGLMSGRL